MHELLVLKALLQVGLVSFGFRIFGLKELIFRMLCASVELRALGCDFLRGIRVSACLKLLCFVIVVLRFRVWVLFLVLWDWVRYATELLRCSYLEIVGCPASWG